MQLLIDTVTSIDHVGPVEVFRIATGAKQATPDQQAHFATCMRCADALAKCRLAIISEQTPPVPPVGGNACPSRAADVTACRQRLFS